MFDMKKGHRERVVIKDENGKEREPYMEGFDPISFHFTESNFNYLNNRKLLSDFKDEMDSGVIAYWESYGVKKELFDQELKDGIYKYSVHTRLDMDINKLYPLLYYSHGGNGTPYEAETIGFSKLIQAEQFIAVYPFNGGYSNEEAPSEFKRIIDELKEKNYPIDWSRVYVSGYSSGSDASESIATLWPEYVTAVAPCPGSNAMYNSLCRITPKAYEKCLGIQVPLLCVGGTMDFGDPYPYPDQACYENFTIWAKDIARVHNYQAINFEESRDLMNTTDDLSKKSIGLNFTHTWTEHLEDRDWYFGEFYDKQYRPVIQFIVGDGIPHITSGVHASLVYSWLKQWSRDQETKELHFTPVYPY
jgi:hypothetical protein